MIEVGRSYVLQESRAEFQLWINKLSLGDCCGDWFYTSPNIGSNPVEVLHVGSFSHPGGERCECEEEILVFCRVFDRSKY